MWCTGIRFPFMHLVSFRLHPVHQFPACRPFFAAPELSPTGRDGPRRPKGQRHVILRNGRCRTIVSRQSLLATWKGHRGTPTPNNGSRRTTKWGLRHENPAMTAALWEGALGITIAVKETELWPSRQA